MVTRPRRWPKNALHYDAQGINLYGCTYVYLLAALFFVFPPSIVLARGLSATLGFSTGVLLGLLATKISHRKSIGIMVALTTMLTPWLFEISRIVLEQVVYQLVLVLFLLALYRAHKHPRWSMLDGALLAHTLALVTYTYATGKLLGPAFAFGLLFFATTRRRLMDVIKTWAMFALTLIPLVVFNMHHPGALQARFHELTYVTPQSTIRQIAVEFTPRYLTNLNVIRWVYIGDANPRHHVPGAMGSLLGATVVVALSCPCPRVAHPWWCYILFGLALSLAPGALTRDNFHAREIAFAIFLIVLNIPTLEWFLESEGNRNQGRREGDGWAAAGRPALSLALMVCTVVQAAYFQMKFRQEGPKRGYAFESDFAPVFAAATALPNRPIYLVREPATICAYWYATVQRRSIAQFAEVPVEKSLRGEL